ncbi:hypothetical protein EV175_006935, partial [Coemansia sp. RSA 1933]
MGMLHMQYHFPLLTKDSSAEDQVAWIETVKVIKTVDPTFNEAQIMLAVDQKIIADFATWVQKDSSHLLNWANLESYLMMVRHACNKPADVMFDLLQLQATGTIEEFNGNFRHKCRLMGWDDKSSEGVGIYHFLMPQAL